MPKYNLTTPPRSGWRFRLAFVCILLIFCVAMGEVGARVFWSLQFHVPFFRADLILYSYYPELKNVEKKRPTHNDDTYDILLLGGSVLEPRWGTVEKEIREQLANFGLRNVRIFNLARASHTSRDSWLKYRALDEARFDLVIFYHGINETRANNVPPELFQIDYGHYSWYEIVNSLAWYHKTSSLSLPYTFRYITLRLKQLIFEARYVPRDSPRPDWVEYGSTYRSRQSFERHVDRILELAARRGDQILLMTFAIHVPENYSLESFRSKSLDYVLYLSPLEIWGKKENVVGGVEAHNQILHLKARQNRKILFVDQHNLMKGTPRYFNDACHFTIAGSTEFVKHILHGVRPVLDKSDLIPN